MMGVMSGVKLENCLSNRMGGTWREGGAEINKGYSQIGMVMGKREDMCSIQISIEEEN